MQATLAQGRKIITGHINILQIRNGPVHILDYKPNARKEKPIEQLTMYALALSRLTGLRLFDFKCAWFDDKNYYEFFPLHVIYKKSRMRIPKSQVRLDSIKADKMGKGGGILNVAKENDEDGMPAIPNLIAEAHSRRFEDEKGGLKLLDESMAECNRMVVYLEQVRDLYSSEVDKLVCEESIQED